MERRIFWAVYHEIGRGTNPFSEVYTGYGFVHNRGLKKTSVFKTFRLDRVTQGWDQGQNSPGNKKKQQVEGLLILHPNRVRKNWGTPNEGGRNKIGKHKRPRRGRGGRRTKTNVRYYYYFSVPLTNCCLFRPVARRRESKRQASKQVTMRRD